MDIIGNGGIDKMNFIPYLIVAIIINCCVVVTWSSMMAITGKKNRFGYWEERWITINKIIICTSIVALLVVGGRRFY